MRSEVIECGRRANAGDTEHDPLWIKVWTGSSPEGKFDLVDTINVTALRGDGNIHVLPITQGPGTAVRSRKLWRINPGGQSYQSIPRTVGLCTTKVRLSLALSPAPPCIAAHTGGHRRARGERGDARGCCLAAGARAPAALWSTNLEAGGGHGMSAAWCAARQLR